MLTLGRILLIRFRLVHLRRDAALSFLAAVVFTVAAITDVIDGYLARRWNCDGRGEVHGSARGQADRDAAMVMMVRLGRLRRGW